MDLESIKNRIKGLERREKVFVFIIFLAVFVVLPYIFLYSPSVKNLDTAKMELQNLKTEIDVLNKTIAAMPVQPVITHEPVTLPATEDLAGMLASITREASLANVEFISLAPEGISNKDSYVEMRMKMELRLRFRALYDFLKNIETRQRLFLITDIKFETNETVYPSGIALVKAVVYLRKK